MSAYKDLVIEAFDRAEQFVRCSQEQALTYACEEIIERELGVRIMVSKDLNTWIEKICEREDIDVPDLMVMRKTQSHLASAHIEENRICIRGKNTTAATVLHEIAHISVGIDGHGVLFRDELVRLCRAHISVEFAAMLHGLYVATGLEMSPWPASATQR